ncbi:TorF family putative porin [Alteromonas sp. ASW11-130]|uniref:TorF family putative porin n=1 Tax=Alteromonas sp. ASW11-130 TaxID=3015775 RepID=UPI00224199DC|nr:TorF family putative porin [Alteromonas sp. ASW11-130]MCW8090936.1 TorF family putative porin [Alteromonas sp. ASW11-130]
MKLAKNTTLLLGAILALMESRALLAKSEANFGVTSNYLWRGVTQSNDNPSVFGGLDYANESGFYTGAWVGTIDWGMGGSTETDLYLGFSGEAGKFGYDVGYIYYAYIDDDYADSDFGELYFNGSYMGFSYGVAYTVNSQVDDGMLFDTGDMYYNVSYGWELANHFSLGVLYGYYDFDAGSESDYGHFQVDISKGDFTFSASKADEEAGDDDVKLVLNWTTSF